MPLVKRTIEPIRIGLNGGVVTECRNELQQVTAISLVDVMRQLSSLSMHVQDMFGELHREASLIVERTLRLNEKVECLRSEINQLNPIVEEVSLHDINLRKPFKFSSLKDQQIITITTRPLCISTIYESCEPPPALQKLNSCRTDGKDSLKFYTDPGYFFELWCQAMQKESKSQMKKHKKSRKTGTISKSAEDNQKWSMDKTQVKNKENISNKSADQHKQLQKVPASHADTSASKSSNSKQKTIPTRATAQKAHKTESLQKPSEKIPEVVEHQNKKVEHCAKECQTPEEKSKTLEAPKTKAEVPVAENVQVSKSIEVSILPTKQSEKFDGYVGVLDLSSRNQNLYENALSLMAKENTYENALALLNEYNDRLDEEGADSKEEEVVRDRATESTPVNLSLKVETEEGDEAANKLAGENDVERARVEIPPSKEPSKHEDQSGSIGEAAHVQPPPQLIGSNRPRMTNLPPAPPTPPELYEGVHLNPDIDKLLEDVQKKTAAMKASGLAGGIEGEGDFEASGTLPKAEVLESLEEALAGDAIEDVVGIDFSDLGDLPPIPSPPRFPPFVDVSGVSSPTSFPSPPTPAYNQRHARMSQFTDEKDSLIVNANNNNNNNVVVLDSLPVKLGDETSVTSEMSAISSESESSVVNSNAANDENSTGVIRDTRCDLLAAIREGIQLRKVEECRQKIERKTKPSGRLDVQSIMEVAFEMRRKMLEEDDSEEDEEEMETNWSDDD